MQYAEYINSVADGADFGFDSSISVEDFGGQCMANAFVALPLSSTSPIYPRDDVISLHAKVDEPPVGALLTCRETDFSYGKASAELVAAFLHNAQGVDIQDAHGNPRRDFVFNKDYVVILADFYEKYSSSFRSGSALWGLFTHVEDGESAPTPYLTKKKSVLATSNIDISLEIEREALFRCVSQSSTFDRYLKLYHLLELHFDVQIVEAIRGLGADLKGIGKLLNSYSGGNELDRLTRLIRSRCSEEAFIDRVLSDAFCEPNYREQWHEILFEYSKESNPYNNKGSEFKVAVTNGYSRSDWVANMNAKQDAIPKFIAYMIYRVRSSIAHMRIGEFLFSFSDEAFVAEAAEPLLREVVTAVYKKLEH
jgi:hypothetical protein